jgi:hypothetical protein
MDVFLALFTQFLAYALYKNYRWAGGATVDWAFLGIFELLNGTVQMIMGFLGVGGISAPSINLPLLNLIHRSVCGYTITIKNF